MDVLLDPNVTMVGVHGLAGIGKTTLAEEVQRQAVQNSSFDKVVSALVTAAPEIKRIQDMIARFVTGSKLEEDDDATRASRLHQILKDKKVLIILDDLWSLLELDKMGIPSWNDNKGCKILLTSRNEDILSNMGSQKNFCLKFLSEEESISLFEKKVIKFEYPEIANEILAKCAGFPLLIVTVGGTLVNKPLHVWKDALKQLSKFEDGEVVKKVHSILESSYDNLDSNDTKQIFLLFGISIYSDTTILNLLRYGLGLGLFKDYTVCEARNHLKTLIDDLKARSLWDVDKQGNVKMHDIVREFAIQIARRDTYAFRERDDKVLTEWPSRGDISGCTIVSIPHSSDIRQLPEDLGCPCVEFLLLYSNWHSVDIPDSTFEGTTKLKVIHFARMELAPLPVGPSHSLTNLHTLYLEDCHLLDLTTITQLERLEILSFRGSDLEALPSEIGKLTRIKLLDVSGCSKLSFIPRGVISKLTSLEELLMRNSFENWEVEEVTDGSNARLSELKCLPRLESLEISVPNTRALSKDLFSNPLERYQVLIGRRWKFDRGSETTKIVKIEVDTSIDLLQRVRELLRGSEILHLRGISTNHLYALEKEGFPKLKELYVADSPELQQVVDCRKLGPTVYFPLLESLESRGLASMVTICQGRPSPESLSQMKRLKIYDCNKLKNLFSLSVVRSLPQLEEIVVARCKEMEALFVAERDPTVYFPLLESLESRGLESMVTICEGRPSPESFSQMKRLEIYDCSKLKNLFSLSAVRSLPQLEEIVVERCKEMEALFVAERDPTVYFPLLKSLESRGLASMVTICQGRPSPESFSQMKRLKIYACNKLKNLFSLSAVRSLPQLEDIVVESCKEMEALFVAESDCGDEGNEVAELPRLRSLTLDNLLQLKCFLYAKESETATGKLMPFFSEKVALPSLETLEIRWIGSIEMIWCSQLGSSAFDKLSSLSVGGCDKLKKVFSSGSLGRFQNLKSLSVFNCPALEEIYQFGDGVVGVPNDEPMILGLNELSLWGLPRLKRIWKEDSTGQYYSFHNLESTSIYDCESLENVFPSVVAKTLSQLKSIQVTNCGKLEEIVAEEEEFWNDRSCSLFPRLTSLEIVKCPKANIFGGGQSRFPNQQPFFSLEKVVPNLKEMCTDGRIFKSMSKCLVGLETLQLSDIRGRTLVDVSQLENMPLLIKLIVRSSRITNLWGCCQTSRIDAAGEPSSSSSSSSIRILELIVVSQLRHVWSRDSQMDPLLPYLEILKLCSCHNLISLANSPSASFWNLSTLELSFCYKATEVVNPSTAKTMANLVTLKIKDCDAIKEIVAAEEQQDSGNDRTIRECIVFNKLKTLELSYLHSLQGFCISGSYSFNFPCLEVVSVKKCPAMRIFCNGDVITPKLNNIGSLRLWGRDLNTTIKLHFEDGLQHIRNLKLSRFPELVEKWSGELPFKRFSNIDELVVDQLPLLLPVAIPSNVLPSLSELKKLVVEKCDSVEEIFDLDGINEDNFSLMSNLSQLMLVDLPKLRHVWNEDLMQLLGLKNLSKLDVHNCSNLTHIFTLPVALELVHLERLFVTECPLVEVIITQPSDEQPPADWDRRTLFPLLNQVQLKNLPSLMGFFSGDDVLRCPNLKSVGVEGCPRMFLLGSTSSSTEEDENIIVQRREDRPCDGDVHEPTLSILNKQVEISRLEELLVQWNSRMDNAWHEILPQSFLDSLKVIKLMGFPTDHELLPSDFAQAMPNLEEFVVVDSLCKQVLTWGPSSVSEMQHAVSFKKLKRLELFNLPELSHLVEEDSQSGSLFQHLGILIVSKCKRLTRLLTSITAMGLVNLWHLTVEECERLTEVVSSNRDEGVDEIVFKKLRSLELHGLPCLASFSSGNCTFSFPSLGNVVVRECPNMKTFAKNAQSTPMLNYVKIAEDNDGNDDDDLWRLVEDGLNDTMEKLFAEKNPGSIC